VRGGEKESGRLFHGKNGYMFTSLLGGDDVIMRIERGGGEKQYQNVTEYSALGTYLSFRKKEAGPVLGGTRSDHEGNAVRGRSKWGGKDRQPDRNLKGKKD